MINFQSRLACLGFFLAAWPGLVLGQEPKTTKSEIQTPTPPTTSTDIPFKSHDGLDMFGRLVLPKDARPRAIVLYVQTAEGQTIDVRRPLGNGKTFNYFDLYRVELPKRNIGFFSYEGRGIRMGDSAPRYETIDRDVFNTSTLDNKVKDVASAIEAVRRQPGLRDTPIFLMGASEGTLLAVEAASRQPAAVQGLVLYGVLAWNMKQNFAYICTDGDFMRARPLDKDNNGTVTREEWESVITDKNIGIDRVDKNGDGSFTVDDVRISNKKLLDAVDNNDFAVLDAWANSGAPAVALPDHWFKDHFAHGEMWSFLQGLDIPVGMFHGDRDNMASMAAVKEMEKKANAAGRSNVEFHYFEGLDHSLNIGQYFVNGTLPAGHQSIFRFIDRIAPKE
jgi:pimeloyl-ACP methyl ester carboxylesterase